MREKMIQTKLLDMFITLHHMSNHIIQVLL